MINRYQHSSGTTQDNPSKEVCIIIIIERESGVNNLLRLGQIDRRSHIVFALEGALGRGARARFALQLAVSVCVSVKNAARKRIHVNIREVKGGYRAQDL